MALPNGKKPGGWHSHAAGPPACGERQGAQAVCRERPAGVRGPSSLASQRARRRKEGGSYKSRVNMSTLTLGGEMWPGV